MKGENLGTPVIQQIPSQVNNEVLSAQNAIESNSNNPDMQKENNLQNTKTRKNLKNNDNTKSPITDIKMLLKLKEDDVELMSLHQIRDAMKVLVQHENISAIVNIMQMLLNRFEYLRQEIEQQNSIDVLKLPEIDEKLMKQTIDESQSIIKEIETIKKSYQQILKEYRKELEQQKQKNYEQKLLIIEQLKELSEKPISDEIWTTYKELMHQWKQIGPVPYKYSSDIYNRFNLYVEKILDNLKISQELRELDQKKNLELKIEICEKLEELLFEESTELVFEKLKELQNRWRSIGPVPRDKREEINARFHTAIEKLKEKRDQSYKKHKEQLEKNLEIKKALIVQMKEIVQQPYNTFKDWSEATEKVQEIFNLWKQTGAVPKIYRDKIWEEFRSYLTKFNEEKKNFFEQQQQIQLDNYNRKISLCVQAEALQNSTDWQKATEAFIALQKEWKSIGPVPKRYSDAIWSRFQKACNTFFQRKKEFLEKQDQTKMQNLEAKKALIEEMKNYQYVENKEENLKAIKQFQRRFLEIGPVPTNEKDKILKEYREILDQLLSKLQISNKEKTNILIDQHYQQLAQTENGKEKLRQELFKINNKIRKVETDLNLWENNIEFFAKSKNAEIVTREFKQKIEHARSELTILKEKQKMLKELLFD